MKNTKCIIVITGPTAIGKTKLSIEIAKHLNTEIVSCDSRQFYKELLIGASPPSPKELLEVKHHFIQHISVKDVFNAGKFELDAIAKIKKIHNSKDAIVVVGGSGLYVDAICKGFDKIPITSKKLRLELNKKFNKKGLIWLQKNVKKIDPIFYESCDKKNPQRLLRALEVYKTSGKQFSSFKQHVTKKRPFNIIKIGLNTDRAKLYKKINKRVDIMLTDGLLEEVKDLVPYQDKNALKTVGYQEIFDFYNNVYTLEKAIENIKQNTRRLAKRQLSWFHRDKNITWFEPNNIKEIKNFIGL